MPRAKSPAATRPAQPNESLIGGLELLQALAGAPAPVGSREMARQFDMEHTRVSRLMGTLAHMGLAEKTSERKYAPGPGLHVLAAMSLRGSRLLTAALPRLERLRAAEPKLSVALGVLWKRQVAYLFFAEPGAALEAAIAGRGLYAAEKSGIGLALLAARTNIEVRELCRAGPGSSETLSAAGLLETLAAVRRQGYALYEGSTLGVAVGEPPVAGLAFAGSIREADAPRLAALLQESAREIATALAGA